MFDVTCHYFRSYNKHFKVRNSLYVVIFASNHQFPFRSTRVEQEHHMYANKGYHPQTPPTTNGSNYGQERKNIRVLTVQTLARLTAQIYTSYSIGKLTGSTSAMFSLTSAEPGEKPPCYHGTLSLGDCDLAKPQQNICAVARGDGAFLGIYTGLKTNR